MNQGARDRVEREEVDRWLAERLKQRHVDVRAVLATEAGRRLLHWIVFDAGGLHEPAARDAGCLMLATTVRDLLDAAEPCSPERIALEAREKRKADDAEIKSAIENRSYEYE